MRLVVIKVANGFLVEPDTRFSNCNVRNDDLHVCEGLDVQRLAALLGKLFDVVAEP